MTRKRSAQSGEHELSGRRTKYLVLSIVPAALNLYVGSPFVQLIKHFHSISRKKRKAILCREIQSFSSTYLVGWKCFISCTKGPPTYKSKTAGIICIYPAQLSVVRGYQDTLTATLNLSFTLISPPRMRLEFVANSTDSLSSIVLGYLFSLAQTSCIVRSRDIWTRRQLRQPGGADVLNQACVPSCADGRWSPTGVAPWKGVIWPLHQEVTLPMCRRGRPQLRVEFHSRAIR